MKRSDPFFERNRDDAVRTQAHLVALDLGDESSRHIMPVAGMAPQAGIGLGETDTRAVERVDSTDMHSVGADNFHSGLHAFNP